MSAGRGVRAEDSRYSRVVRLQRKEKFQRAWLAGDLGSEGAGQALSGVGLGSAGEGGLTCYEANIPCLAQSGEY